MRYFSLTNKMLISNLINVIYIKFIINFAKLREKYIILKLSVLLYIANYLLLRYNTYSN